MPRFWIRLPQRMFSARMNAANCCGLLTWMSAPMLSKAVRADCVAAPVFQASARWLTMSRGVDDGAIRPNQVTTARPCPATAATEGKARERCAEVTAYHLALARLHLGQGGGQRAFETHGNRAGQQIVGNLLGALARHMG